MRFDGRRSGDWERRTALPSCDGLRGWTGLWTGDAIQDMDRSLSTFRKTPSLQRCLTHIPREQTFEANHSLRDSTERFHYHRAVGDISVGALADYPLRFRDVSFPFFNFSCFNFSRFILSSFSLSASRCR